MNQIILSLSLLLSAVPSLAATKWGNCPNSHGTSIQEIFWKSDVNGGSGPEYNLGSGQTLSNAGSVCQPGTTMKAEGWSAELKTDLNPVKSVKSFTTVKTPEEFKKFLNNFGIQVEEQTQLDEAVKSYLAASPNASILVGKSGKDALVVLATSDGKYRSATFLEFHQNSAEQ